ncbi:hypothetical protein E4T47_04137 [Aureobasidium subglaciale]|nr:hypothetical protein E4T47_04137 [Aureobasidium subglaciale]
MAPPVLHHCADASAAAVVCLRQLFPFHHRGTPRRREGQKHLGEITTDPSSCTSCCCLSLNIKRAMSLPMPSNTSSSKSSGSKTPSSNVSGGKPPVSSSKPAIHNYGPGVKYGPPEPSSRDALNARRWR